jgi:glycosyltransferase involved in cell wall biosynthesis
MLIFPSECYETFGRTAIEAFAKGTPVIASNHGAPADVVDHNRTGLLFRPGDAADLALNVHALLDDPARLAKMRVEARAEFAAKYTGDRAYHQLMEIYNRAIALHRPQPNASLTPQVTS